MSRFPTFASITSNVITVKLIPNLAHLIGNMCTKNCNMLDSKITNLPMADAYLTKNAKIRIYDSRMVKKSLIINPYKILHKFIIIQSAKEALSYLQKLTRIFVSSLRSRICFTVLFSSYRQICQLNTNIDTIITSNALTVKLILNLAYLVYNIFTKIS